MTDSIFIDDAVFDENFVPENLECRDSQIKELAHSLKRIGVGKLIKNVFVYGPPGVGKTSVIRWILGEHFQNSSVYVNCWSKKTAHKILEEILRQSGQIVQGRESTSDLVRKLEVSRKRPIICLDECDQIKDLDVLYHLTRNGHGIVLISNQSFALTNADYRTRSSLFLHEIEFKPYTAEEITQILKNRIRYGLRPYSISPDLVSIIAKTSGGDARVAIQTLRLAARDAESSGEDIITINEIKEAAKCARKYRMSYLLGKLSDNQKIIFEILKKNRNMPSGRLYEELRNNSSEEIIERSYRNYMHRMKELGLVRESGSGRWKRYEIII